MPSLEQILCQALELLSDGDEPDLLVDEGRGEDRGSKNASSEEGTMTKRGLPKQ
jgi:hypothetical protein